MSLNGRLVWSILITLLLKLLIFLSAKFVKSNFTDTIRFWFLMCLIPFTFWLLLHDSLSDKVGNTTAKFIQMDKAKVTDFYQLSFRAHNHKRRVFQAGIPGINSWPQILFCCFGFFFKYMEKLSIKKIQTVHQMI